MLDNSFQNSSFQQSMYDHSCVGSEILEDLSEHTGNQLEYSRDYSQAFAAENSSQSSDYNIYGSEDETNEIYNKYAQSLANIRMHESLKNLDDRRVEGDRIQLKLNFYLLKNEEEDDLPEIDEVSEEYEEYS